MFHLRTVSSGQPGRRARRGGTLALAALGAAVATAATACGTPGTSSTGSTVPTGVSTDIGTAPVTLTLYDGAGLQSLDQALVAGFRQTHPNVTINVRTDPDSVLSQNLPRVLASTEPPDIARTVALADEVKDGLLTNLDAYAKAWGWDSLPAAQLNQYRVSQAGVRGSGAPYAMASGFTVSGVFYNKQLAAQIGMTTPPKTIDELSGLLAKAKAAGQQPIMVSNTTGNAVNAFQALLNDYLGPQAVNNWIYHEASATIDTPQAVTAADAFNQWVKAGYFPADVNGVDSSTALGRFIAGQGVFFVDGNWDTTKLDSQMAGKVGFFEFPPLQAGGPVTAMSDPASSFGIPANSQHKNAAAAFLDWLRSPEARQITVDQGFAPSGTGSVPNVAPGSVNAEVQDAFAKLVADNGQVQYVQNATNGIQSTAWAPQSQSLIAGRISPQQFVSAVQREYAKELGR